MKTAQKSKVNKVTGKIYLRLWSKLAQTSNLKDKGIALFLAFLQTGNSKDKSIVFLFTFVRVPISWLSEIVGEYVMWWGGGSGRSQENGGCEFGYSRGGRGICLCLWIHHYTLPTTYQTSFLIFSIGLLEGVYSVCQGRAEEHILQHWKSVYPNPFKYWNQINI